jgi:bacteriocin biosynthesis cyclodehydratase domain-containing protein
VTHPRPELPLLAPWYRLVRADGALVLEHGHRVLRLDGAAVEELLPRVLPLLDGTRPIADIAAALGAADEEPVRHAVGVLAEAGVVVDGPPAECGAELRATAHLLAAERGASPAAVAGRLADAAVGVVGSSAAAGEATRLLRRSGVACVERRAWDDPGHADVFLVAPSPGEAAGELAEWNRRLLRLGTPWLQLLPFDGCFTGVGPLYVPGDTACHDCYRLRRAAALGIGPLSDALDEAPTAAEAGPVLETAAAAVAVLHLLRWVAHRDAALPGVLFALEPRDGVRVTAHRVLRVPRCPACSPVEHVAPPLPWFQPPAEVVA